LSVTPRHELVEARDLVVRDATENVGDRLSIPRPTERLAQFDLCRLLAQGRRSESRARASGMRSTPDP